jgi:hypothetical protein
MAEELMPSESESLESRENLEAEVDYVEDPSLSHRILDYINTKKGDVMFGRCIAMLEQIAPGAKTLLEAKAEIQKGNPTLEYKKW